MNEIIEELNFLKKYLNLRQIKTLLLVKIL